MNAYSDGIAEAGKGCMDVLAFGDDFAGQTGMVLSPRKMARYAESLLAK